MSRNMMSAAERREYADQLLEAMQQARYVKQKRRNQQWHHATERVLGVFGAGDPDLRH